MANSLTEQGVKEHSCTYAISNHVPGITWTSSARMDTNCIPWENEVFGSHQPYSIHPQWHLKTADRR